MNKQLVIDLDRYVSNATEPLKEIPCEYCKKCIKPHQKFNQDLIDLKTCPIGAETISGCDAKGILSEDCGIKTSEDNTITTRTIIIAPNDILQAVYAGMIVQKASEINQRKGNRKNTKMPDSGYIKNKKARERFNKKNNYRSFEEYETNHCYVCANSDHYFGGAVKCNKCAKTTKHFYVNKATGFYSKNFGNRPNVVYAVCDLFKRCKQ